jgi:hypothetical protein
MAFTDGLCRNDAMQSPLRLGVPNAGPWWHLGLLGGRIDGDSGIRGVDNWLTLSSL